MNDIVYMKDYSAKLEELGLTRDEKGRHFVGYLDDANGVCAAHIYHHIDRRAVVITYRIGGTIKSGGTDEKCVIPATRFMKMTKKDITKLRMKIKVTQLEVNRMLCGIENAKIRLTEGIDTVGNR